jgi:hypothetical protein
MLASMNTTAITDVSPWVTMPVSNLVRYKSSGVDFARAKIGGKLIRQSFKTENGHSFHCQTSLQAMLEAEQRRLSLMKDVRAGNRMFSDAMEAFRHELENNVEITPDNAVR